MAIGDLYSMRIVMEQFGIRYENRYFYLQTAGTGTARRVSTAWETDIQPALEDVISDSVDFLEAIVTNLDDPTDFYTEVLIGSGNLAGQSLPGYNQWSFKLSSPTKQIRSGGKRFSGINEVSQQDGAAVGGAITDLNILAVALAAQIEHAGSSSFYTLMLHTDGNLATEGEPLTVAVTTVEYDRISTQLSRR